MHPHKKILMSYSISINTIRCEKKPTDDDVADVPTTAAQWLFICMLYESRFFKTCNLTFLGRDLTLINVHLYSTRVATNCSLNEYTFYNGFRYANLWLYLWNAYSFVSQWFPWDDDDATHLMYLLPLCFYWSKARLSISKCGKM